MQEDLKKLEGILERSSKRALPLRGKDDSPEMLPSKKKQIVEVEENAAAIINQKVDIRRPEPELRLTVTANTAAIINQNVNSKDASGVIISLEPELRLDSQGDLVSYEVALPPEQIRILDQAKRMIEARRKAKLEESERIAAVETERIRREGVEARRKAVMDADKASDVAKSPPPEKYLGLGKSAQHNFHSKMGDYKGYNRTIAPTPDLFRNYNAARDAHLSDGQLSTMALEAWRSHLRNKHDYLPDRARRYTSITLKLSVRQ